MHSREPIVNDLTSDGYLPIDFDADAMTLHSLEGVGRSIGEFHSRQQMEDKMRRLAAITHSSQDAILSYDFEGRITEWLGGAERLFGYTAEEMVGARIERIVPEDRLEELRAIRSRIQAGESIELMETVRMKKDGSLVHVSVSSTPVRNQEGRAIGVASIDRDMTRQKETADRLVDANKQKDEFLALLGHELRNPLAAIRSATELLKAIQFAPADVRLRRALDVLERQGIHMTKLLDGLLDISRIARGKIRLEKEVVDLATVCGDTIVDVRERLGGRALDLQADLPSGPVWVDADTVRLIQIVDNLLSNAVKFTEDGGTITLRLRQENDSAMLTVRDTGVGIEPERIDGIFSGFGQAETNPAHSQDGLGIGLALVRSLVELHGGGITADSEGRHCGTEFAVRLPVTQKTSQPLASTASVPPVSRHILLIEDDADSAELLGTILELAGHRVSVARSGKQGIKLSKARKPEVVLCDIGLPDGMTGFDVAHALRADPDFVDVLLVALTGFGRPQDKVRAAEAGFDLHLTKPIDMARLERVLAERLADGKTTSRE